MCNPILTLKVQLFIYNQVTEADVVNLHWTKSCNLSELDSNTDSSLRNPSLRDIDPHHATAHPASWHCEVRFWWEQSGLGPSFHPQHLCCRPRPLSQAYTCQETRQHILSMDTLIHMYISGFKTWCALSVIKEKTFLKKKGSFYSVTSPYEKESM